MVFQPQPQENRAALLLSKGTVRTAWGSYEDNGCYEGWLISYDETSLPDGWVCSTLRRTCHVALMAHRYGRPRMRRLTIWL